MNTSNQITSSNNLELLVVHSISGPIRETLIEHISNRGLLKLAVLNRDLSDEYSPIIKKRINCLKALELPLNYRHLIERSCEITTHFSLYQNQERLYPKLVEAIKETEDLHKTVYQMNMNELEILEESKLYQKQTECIQYLKKMDQYALSCSRKFRKSANSFVKLTSHLVAYRNASNQNKNATIHHPTQTSEF